MSEPYGFADFIAEVRAVMPRALPPSDTLRTLRPGFERLLANRTFLDEEIRKLGTAADEVCLHHDREHDFVVLARGVSRGAARQGESHAAMPHDHGPLWALYGLYEGPARLQRYAPDPGAQDGPFPGLRLLSDTPSEAGAIDAILPHSMHLPVFPENGGNVIIVVYSQPLGKVVRRGYVAARKAVVDFQGAFPPTA